MRTALFVLVFALAAQTAWAQQYPAYYYGQQYPSYGQQYPGYGQQQGYPQQAMPQSYYGNGYYPNGGAPNNYYYNYPSNNTYPPAYYGNQPAARGYYPPNPATPVYVYAPPSQPYTTTSAPRTPAQPASWPVPAVKASAAQIVEPGDVYEAVPLIPGDARPAAVSFCRPTHDFFWISADYTMSFIRPMRVDTPLVTTGSSTNAAPGALGQSGTAVLFGDNSVNFNMFSGVRLEAGIFLDEGNHFSLDWRGNLLFPNTETFSIAGDGNGNPVIARPITNTATGAAGAFVNSLPGTINGSILIQSKSLMAGTEFNAGYHSYFGEHLHTEALIGLRYTRLAESMNIGEQINPLVPGFTTFQGNFVNPPNALVDHDGFSTTNQFFGGQVGGRVSWEEKWFTLDVFGKLALGATVEQTRIDGSSTLVSPAGNVTTPGGILALPSNIGTFNRTVFGIMPEVGLNLGVDLCQNVRLNLGYSLLMWSRVVRPGFQLNDNVNPSLVPGSPAGTFGVGGGPQSPTYKFNDEFFYSHTFNIGVEVHF